MPIYAYKCESCGLAKDVLQKVSDAPLTQCPGCAAQTFKKQLSAPGFQLKGTGWYATDFKGGGSTTAPATTPEASASKPADAASAKAATEPSAPAGGCGGSCACH